MDFWERTKDTIRQQNTTQEWVAQKANISFGTFQGWIAKGRIPRADEASRIARVLGVTVEYLLSGQDSLGLPPRLAALSRELVRLPEEDIEEIEALVAVKTSRQEKLEVVDELQQNA